MDVGEAAFANTKTFKSICIKHTHIKLLMRTKIQLIIIKEEITNPHMSNGKETSANVSGFYETYTG